MEQTEFSMELRPMSKEEMLYCYAQSQQISMQTGLIGHLRGDMDSNGQGFFTTFFDFRSSLKTDEFKAEFDTVINSLRNDPEYRQCLGNRSKLSSFCHAHPESRIQRDRDDYGFRVNTDAYSYLVRLNPNRGEYNFYVYCYKRENLDRHMKQAERGIRFIDSNYREKFRVADGDKIRVTYGDGESHEATVRYIDDYHMEIGRQLYHICEFAERFEAQKCTDIYPLRASLPEHCYSMLSAENKLIKIVKGESGYHGLCQLDEHGRKTVDAKNQAIGVSKAQEAAMVIGSMFGWDKPGADPKNYDDQGIPIAAHPRNRGDAR